ncbi:GSCOCG00003174001-RA-CDS [Cotesia congregata]|nr:GSCOCG00003174001-RA-CDS [Cotesia congregata]
MCTSSAITRAHLTPALFATAQHSTSIHIYIFTPTLSFTFTFTPTPAPT